MIINDFDVLNAGIGPSETQPELFIDPDAVLPFSIAFEGFQTIPGRNPEVSQPPRDLQLTKLAPGHRGNIGKTLYRIAFTKGLSIVAPKGFYHFPIVTQHVINVKRF